MHLHWAVETDGKYEKPRDQDSPLMEDCIRDVTSQQRMSCETTVYSFPSSAYWYLIGGPGPSSRATSMKVAGTPSFRSCVFSAKPDREKWRMLKLVLSLKS